MESANVHFVIYHRIPYWLNIIVGPLLSYLSVLMNIFIFSALLDKRLRSPSVVLMQGLSLADGLTALFVYGFEPLFVNLYSEIGRIDTNDNFTIGITVLEDDEIISKDIKIDVKDIKELVDLKYPYCLLHYIVTLLSECFHLVSILLTASLGIQKLLVVAFPIWSRMNITINKFIISCTVCFVIALTISMPRAFIVNFCSATGINCFISKPNKNLETYTLTIYPILFNTLLIFAVISMIFSSVFITIKICNRKHTWRHSLATKSEYQSCVLILSVMVVFLLSELPRLYLNANLISTYRTELGKEDIAWTKVEAEINQRSTACFKSADKVIRKRMSKWNLSFADTFSHTVNISCGNGTKVPGSVDTSSVDDLVDFVVNHVYEFYGNQLKYRINPTYNDIIGDLFQKLSDLTENNYKNVLGKISSILDCTVDNMRAEVIMIEYALAHSNCYEHVLNSLSTKIPLFILGSSPYSEPVNHILNIIWGNIDISLEHLKLFMEVLKISTVLACASNFIIYIFMSENLRKSFSRRLSFSSAVA